jgi:catechol 2,3-dioxygenase-like lactoylglutathione lyase family enzyme
LSVHGPYPLISTTTGASVVRQSGSRRPVLSKHYRVRYAANQGNSSKSNKCVAVGSVHLCLYIDDMDAALARVAQAGWLPVPEPQTVEGGERDGMRLIYLRGADGVTLEFIQNAPGR